MKQQNQFGSAFRAVRLARGLTQEDFAHHSGRTYISELERGIKQPTLQKIDDLVVPLEVHPLTLIALAYLKQWDVMCCEDLLGKVRDELGEILAASLRS
ncbi:helix-turn-helix domain-containing protein [Telluria mixta]|uniref:Helix-turn-helix domain-containing protein n=1 Tax=Telluria mixta TaxID=34071 RepID=A0ABT2BRX4_9BURK|nr:helix-turn-helix transcriptional regulator [Telluria mixta]MCS0627869.1 helix-turn-helix domain-containing protein [Telluria mixta]WEM94013.1 helix-turn-helix transcriptional regulator [Telluria mixta]